MTYKCALSNPSNDVAIRLNQLNALFGICGTAISTETLQDAIPVELDALAGLLAVLPMNYNVACPVSTVPTPYSTYVEDCIAKLVPQDPIQELLNKTYGGASTVGILVDMNAKELTSVPYITRALELCPGHTRVTLCLLNYKESDAERISAHRKIPHVEVIVYSPLQTLGILRACGYQALTGSLLGYWAASQCANVVYPSPWTPGSKLTAPSHWQSVPCCWTYTRYFDRAYYINLDKRQDRRVHMDTQMLKLSVAPVRINAVDGSNIKWEPRFGIKSQFWNGGALAYCLSYRGAIIDAIKQGYDKVLIMDDDAVLTDNFYSVLEDAFKTLPKDWHMLYLGANHGVPTPVAMPTEKERVSDSVYKMLGSMGSHAIILNKVCFNTILNFLASPYAPLDMFFATYQKFFPCYITYPGLAYQMGGHSDILEKTVDYVKDWKIDYINHIDSRKIV